MPNDTLGSDTRFKAGNPGRPKGSTNKATNATRKFFAEFLEKNRDRMQRLLDKIEDGHIVYDETTNTDGTTIKTARVIREPTPEGAAKLIISVTEFCLPKLQRVEWTGEDGEPLAPPVFNLGFKNGGPGSA